MMTEAEKLDLKKSMKYAQEVLEKGLITGEDAQQLYRMIAYYEDKIKEQEATERKDNHENKDT